MFKKLIYVSLMLTMFLNAKDFNANFSEVVQNAPNKIGVYIVRKNNKVVYVGRAIENRRGQSTKGLRKRLKEHYRSASSGNRLMYAHRDSLNITIETFETVDEVKRREAELIRLFDTVEKGWNKRYED